MENTRENLSSILFGLMRLHILIQPRPPLPPDFVIIAQPTLIEGKNSPLLYNVGLK